MLAKRRTDPFQLEVGMAGVKLGDRIAQVACAHASRLGAIAVKVGLSGHAAVVVEDAASLARAQKGAAQAGVFVETHQSPAARLPLETGSLDLVLVDDTAGFLAQRSEAELAAAIREIERVLRAGARVLIIQSLPSTGWSAIFSRGSQTPPLDPRPTLEAHGFRLTRILGEGEGLRFVEGVKPRVPPSA